MVDIPIPRLATGVIVRFAHTSGLQPYSANSFPFSRLRWLDAGAVLEVGLFDGLALEDA